VQILYNSAEENSFENARGKLFLQELIRFCCLLDEERYDYINHGTSSSGDKQPGCCHWTKRVIRSTPSSGRSSSVDIQPDIRNGSKLIKECAKLPEERKFLSAKRVRIGKKKKHLHLFILKQQVHWIKQPRIYLPPCLLLRT